MLKYVWMGGVFVFLLLGLLSGVMPGEHQLMTVLCLVAEFAALERFVASTR